MTFWQILLDVLSGILLPWLVLVGFLLIASR